MNLIVLRPAGQEPVPGDIFVYRLRNGPFGYGRVINNKTTLGGTDYNSVMIYLYNVFSQDKNIVPELSPSNLLVAPTGVNCTPWRKGIFENICNVPLRSADVLEQHCFKSIGGYLDELGRPLSKRIEPCGLYAIGSFRSIELEICGALGLPPVDD